MVAIGSAAIQDQVFCIVIYNCLEGLAGGIRGEDDSKRPLAAFYSTILQDDSPATGDPLSRCPQAEPLRLRLIDVTRDVNQAVLRAYGPISHIYDIGIALKRRLTEDGYVCIAFHVQSDTISDRCI